MSFKRIIILITAAVVFTAAAAWCQDTAESVTIDLSQDKGPVTYRASGFLHAMTAETPGPEMVDPLKPKTFRMAAEDWHGVKAGAFANYQRVKKLGATMQVVVSDNHGYGLSTWWPGDNGDWGAWELLVESLVKRAQAAGYDFQWDIWNEPDIKYFWPHDRDRLFETWKRGYQKIRSLDPKAVIVGPSIAGFNMDYLKAFLLYAKENNVVPNIISWHEFGAARSIPKHAAEIRRFIATNGIDIKEISVNEILNGKQCLLPGMTVHFFANLERAGIDSACHACWNDKDNGVSACENHSLDGILTHPDKRPRAPWWVYRSYAEITGRLVELTPSKALDGVAGIDPAAREARFILGRNSETGGNVDVVVKGFKSRGILGSKGKVKVVARKIVDTGWEAHGQPAVTVNQEYAIEGDSVKITLPDFGPRDAYTVTIR